VTLALFRGRGNYFPEPNVDRVSLTLCLATCVFCALAIFAIYIRFCAPLKTLEDLTIKEKKEVIDDGNLYFILYFEEVPNKVFCARAKDFPELPLAQVGQKATIQFVEHYEDDYKIDIRQFDLLDVKIDKSKIKLEAEDTHIEIEILQRE
jgi:hypothetical protein